MKTNITDISYLQLPYALIGKQIFCETATARPWTDKLIVIGVDLSSSFALDSCGVMTQTQSYVLKIKACGVLRVLELSNLQDRPETRFTVDLE